MTDRVAAERERILAEYERRHCEIPARRYAPDGAAEAFFRCGRLRVARELLKFRAIELGERSECLEVGYGTAGWLPDLLDWGVSPSSVHGIELDARRAREAMERFPGLDLQIGDACEMRWPDGTFDLAIASTVFSSVLDSEVREILAAEIGRVVRSEGALLWYDFRVNNPRNPAVVGMSRREIGRLFPAWTLAARSATLVPTVARRLAGSFPGLASALERIPLLRTHLVAVVCKP